MFSSRTLLTPMIIVSAYVCSIEAKSEDEVIHIADGGTECECVKVRDLVCGSDNVTYTNDCVLTDCEAKHKPGLRIQYRGACNLANSIQREKRALHLHKPLHAGKELFHKRHQPSWAKHVLRRKNKNVFGHVKKPTKRQQIRGHQKRPWFRPKGK